MLGAVETYAGPGGQAIYFPRQPPATALMLALLEGALILDPEGCLRVAPNKGAPPLVLWHYDSTLEVAGSIVEVFDGAGQVVARVGEPVRMGGGAMESAQAMANWDRQIAGLPLAGCPGPYWVLGGIESLQAQAVPDIYVQPLPGGGLFLYQSKPAPEESLLAAALTLDERGCVRAGGFAVLWPPEVWPREDGAGTRFVRIEGDSEVTVAALGAPAALRGAERSPSDYRYFEEKVPCAGPYWGVARVEPSQ